MTRRIARFNLGYAPDQWDALKNALGTSAQRIELLEKAGMLTSGERGSKYDRFRHRVMFPILDRRGRTIAFGGRVLVKEDTPKYLNSPETPLFHKGRELFGLWQVREAHQKIPRLIVVEGYMDVISLHQFGVPQAVATLGTATTRDHAEILFRQCADVYFCFDGDRAGRQAAWRAVESVLPRMRDGRQAMFLFLPDGEDPDTLIRKEGTQGFEERLKNATPLSEFFFAEIGKDVNLASLDGKARLAERARPLLAQIPDGAFRDLMLAELDRLTGVHVQVAAPPTDRADAKTSAARPQQRSLVRSAVALLVQNPQLACRDRTAVDVRRTAPARHSAAGRADRAVSRSSRDHDRRADRAFRRTRGSDVAAETRRHGFPRRRGREPRGIPRRDPATRSADRIAAPVGPAPAPEGARRQGHRGPDRSRTQRVAPAARSTKETRAQ